MTIFFQQTQNAIGGDDQDAYCSGLTVAGSGSVGNNTATVGGTAGVSNIALGGDKDLDAGVTRAVIWMELPINSTDWAAGDWVVRLNIAVSASPLEWSSTHICRLNSSYVNQGTVGSLTGQTTDLSTTGVKTHTVSGAIQSGVASSDVAMIILGFTVPSGGMDEKPRYLPNQIIDQPEAAGGITADPGFVEISFVGFSPTTLTTANKIVSPSDGAIVFSGFAPTPVVSALKEAFPGFGAIAFAGFAPTATTTAQQFASPTLGTITFTGAAPVITKTENQIVEPTLVTVDFAGQAPTAVTTANQIVNPAVGSFVFNGFAPTPSVTAGQTKNPSVGAVTFTGVAPTAATTANHDISPALGSVAFTGAVPLVTSGAGKIASPSIGVVVFTGFTPTATTTNNRVASPSFVTVDFTGFAPSLDAGIQLNKGSVTFTGYAASITVTNNNYATPSQGAIAFTGFAPTVAGGEAVVVAAVRTAPPVGKHRRRLRKLPDGRITLADDAELRRLLSFYKVKEEELEPLVLPTRRRRRKIMNRAIPAPDIIEQLEEESDIQYVLQEIAKSLR